MTGGNAMIGRCLIAAGCLTVALAVPSAEQRRRAVDLEAADCSRHNMQFGDYEVGRAVRRETAPLSVGQLDIEPEANGGVQVEPGTGSGYSITACIGAGAPTLAEAQQAADDVQLSVEGSRVRVRAGRQVRNWSVQLIVEAPEGADLRITTTNGPIGLSNVSGKFNVRASNGPIGVQGVSGTLAARAQNGPIHVEGSRGEFDVDTSNGPISISLSGTRWDGHLDARAHNGPLNVSIPANYQSGVEVTSSFNSPWNCRVDACRSGSRDWDERSRSLRVGSDPVVVRISTVNGPVTIDQR
jgi:DUF4097 and DUF4098 domain-containing protein YvlB